MTLLPLAFCLILCSNEASINDASSIIIKPSGTGFPVSSRLLSRNPVLTTRKPSSECIVVVSLLVAALNASAALFVVAVRCTSMSLYVPSELATKLWPFLHKGIN